MIRVSIMVRGCRVVGAVATPLLVCWCRGSFGVCRVSSFPSVVVAAKPLLHLRLSASFARKVVVACVHGNFPGNTRMIRISSSSCCCCCCCFFFAHSLLPSHRHALINPGGAWIATTGIHTQKNVYRRLISSPLSSLIIILIFPSSCTIPSAFFLILLVAVKLFFSSFCVATVTVSE